MNNQDPNMMNQPQMPMQPVNPGPGPGDGQAKTGMILGIISIVLSVVSDFMAFAPIVGVIMSVVALVAGIVGLVMAVKGGNANAKAGYPKGGAATAGIVCVIIGIVFSGISVACTGCWACAVCTVQNAGGKVAKELSKALASYKL